MSNFLGYLGEAAVVLGHNTGVRTVKLLDDIETLVELCEDVHH